jgi:hypothetical protein
LQSGATPAVASIAAVNSSVWLALKDNGVAGEGCHPSKASVSSRLQVQRHLAEAIERRFQVLDAPTAASPFSASTVMRWVKVAPLSSDVG